MHASIQTYHPSISLQGRELTNAGLVSALLPAAVFGGGVVTLTEPQWLSFGTHMHAHQTIYTCNNKVVSWPRPSAKEWLLYQPAPASTPYILYIYTYIYTFICTYMYMYMYICTYIHIR